MSPLILHGSDNLTKNCNFGIALLIKILICLRWTRNCDELIPELRDSRVVDLQWGKKYYEVYSN